MSPMLSRHSSLRVHNMTWFMSVTARDGPIRIIDDYIGRKTLQLLCEYIVSKSLRMNEWMKWTTICKLHLTITTITPQFSVSVRSIYKPVNRTFSDNRLTMKNIPSWAHSSAMTCCYSRWSMAITLLLRDWHLFSRVIDVNLIICLSVCLSVCVRAAVQ